MNRIPQAVLGHTVNQVTVQTITQPKFLSMRLQRALQTTVGLHQNYTWPLDHLNFTATNDVRDQWTTHTEETRRCAYRINPNYYGQIFDHYRGLICKTEIHGDDKLYYDEIQSYLHQVQKPNSLVSQERGQFIHESSPRREGSISRLSPDRKPFINENSTREEARSQTKLTKRDTIIEVQAQFSTRYDTFTHGLSTSSHWHLPTKSEVRTSQEGRLLAPEYYDRN